MSTIPSISLIPSGYKANKVYSVLPTDGAADFDFARTSTANRVNSNNLIEEVATGVPRLDYTDGTCPSLLLEPQSTNLITYPLSFGNSYWTKSGASIEGDASTAGVEKVVNGDFATDSDWGKYGTTSISGGVAELAANGANNALFQTNIFTANSQTLKTVKVTYTVVSDTLNSGTFKINGFDGNDLSDSVIAPKEIGINSVYINVYRASGTENRITFWITSSSASGSLKIDNVSVKEVQGFSAPSVDNPLEAYKLITDTSTGGHDMYSDTLSFAANTTYTFSSYIKKGELNIISMQYNGAGAFTTNPVTEFNLDTGVVVSSINGLGVITDLGNGWYRCSITASTGASISSERAWFRFGTSTGDGTSGVYIFGAQLEQQSFATSLMLPNTEGSTVTRVAETASKTGLASYINSVEGVFYAHLSTDDSSSEKALALSDGATNNRINIRIINNTIKGVVIVGGVLVCNISYSASSVVDYNKIAFKFKEDDFSLWFNGVNVGSDTSGATFTANTLTDISFDYGVASASNFYGNCKDLRVYKTALSDAELVTLTTI